ncbi:hypothetical protein HYFRA_00006873 [Hymenoscyphus fraxineus]|uniref:Uncharacterized protein n=1 Tax=Hymenoscyphus fraxineus TaxID=746836 RepID=A0A9N9KMB0_9HELO|nr:hypothetical protein HYFRA_00006873 [Hymenoscyphus fraxineus]
MFYSSAEDMRICEYANGHQAILGCIRGSEGLIMEEEKDKWELEWEARRDTRRGRGVSTVSYPATKPEPEPEPERIHTPYSIPHRTAPPAPYDSPPRALRPGARIAIVGYLPGEGQGLGSGNRGLGRQIQGQGLRNFQPSLASPWPLPIFGNIGILKQQLRIDCFSTSYSMSHWDKQEQFGHIDTRTESLLESYCFTVAFGCCGDCSARVQPGATDARRPKGGQMGMRVGHYE